jgi:hypothetical protein
VLIVPDKRQTFDRRRPVTPLEHLVDDESVGRGEDDATHLPEILALHDLALDPGAGSRAEFEQRSRENARHRSLHHHVFDLALSRAVLEATGFIVREQSAEPPHHLITVAVNGEI